MKRLKLKIAMVAVVAAVAGYGIYQNQTKEVGMSELALANVEALAQNEGTAVAMCYMRVGFTGKYDSRRFCDSRTNGTTIYPCLGHSMDFYDDSRVDRCTSH